MARLRIIITDPPPPPIDPPPPDVGPPPADPSGATRSQVVAGAGLTNAGILTPSGSVTVTTTNAVIENLDITGTLNIKANGVTVRNCRVQGYSSVSVVRLYPPFGNCLIEHCEVVALASSTDPLKAPNAAISGSTCVGLNVRWCDISGFADGIKAEETSYIEYNVIAMSKPSGSAKHLDGIQNSGRSHVFIRGNVIDADISLGGNAAVFTQAYNGSSCKHIYDNIVQGNWLKGGNYSVYMMGGKNIASCDNDLYKWVHDQHVVDNVFEGSERYGPLWVRVPTETEVVGNVDSLGNPVVSI